MPTSSNIGRDMARVALFAALIVVLGLVSIPLPTGVPIVLQNLGVILAGVVLGARLAPLSVLIVLALAATGLPVLSGGRGGLGVFVGPTAGYLVGWIFVAIVVGLLARADGRIVWWRVALAGVVGAIVVGYLFGIPVTALVLGLPLGETIIAATIYLPGDLIKIALATLLAVALYRAYPPAFAFPTRRSAVTISEPDGAQVA